VAAGNTIAAAQMAQLSGLTERRLRELASEGWFPKAVDGQFQLVPTIQGLLRYYRQGDENRALHDTYDSIASCAAATGIPVAAIKHAKRSGCTAFRGSRVQLAPLLRWLFEHQERPKVSYEQERAQNVALQNTKLSCEIRQLKRELIPLEEVAHAGSELGSAIRIVVARLHRAAPSFVGLPVETIEARLKEEEDEILKQLNTLRERVDEWQRTAAE
jgi:hypothetical protein